jgi:hypothetical protein
MFWFILHQIVKNLDYYTIETRNLTVFLFGGLLYAITHSYISCSSFKKDSFLSKLAMWYTYIMITDAFAMGVIYKNKFNESICREVKETIGKNAGNKENNKHITKKTIILEDSVDENTIEEDIKDVEIKDLQDIKDDESIKSDNLKIE